MPLYCGKSERGAQVGLGKGKIVSIGNGVGGGRG